MSKEHRKKLADEYKENPKHPEYKIYYDEFYKETDATIEEVKEEEVVKTKKGKKK